MLSARTQFLGLSSQLTGFTSAELEGTGMADDYFGRVSDIIGSNIFGELMLAYAEVVESKNNDVANYKKLMSDPKLGPVAANIISLWYLGQWNQLPKQWRNDYGANALDRNHVVSAEAYRQGLVWSAMGAHPMGTKQQGFGAWSFPPPDPLI